MENSTSAPSSQSSSTSSQDSLHKTQQQLQQQQLAAAAAVGGAGGTGGGVKKKPSTLKTSLGRIFSKKEKTRKDAGALMSTGGTLGKGRITSNTLLTNVLKRDGFSYVNLFKEGTLQYQGQKGGRALGSGDFTLTNTSTVQELIDFIESASGIQTAQVDSTNPIPVSKDSILGETGTLVPGGYIKDGTIRFVSNNGKLNALDIDLTAFRLTDTTGNVDVPNLAFGTIQRHRPTRCKLAERVRRSCSPREGRLLRQFKISP